MKTAYFDYNATTPILPEVREVMAAYEGEFFANPSSFHEAGRAAAKAIKEARRQAAVLLGVHEEHEIIFTSGGTESNNAALRSAIVTTGKKKIVTSSIEHSSIRGLCRQLEKEGCEIVEIGVDENGQLDLEALADALDDRTAVLTLMSANNETGILLPIQEAGKIAKERGILFHVDAVQSIGKIPIVLKEESINFLSVSAHKLYGPKGVGVLYAKKGTEFRPLIVGGSQERGRRGGTENVSGIAGFGAACKRVVSDFEKESARVEELRNHLEMKIARRIPGAPVSGQTVRRIPNTSHILFRDVDAEALLINLDQRGIFASSGSACMSGSREPSHVLKAMGRSDEEANSGIRLSLGRGSSAEQIDYLVEVLEETLTRLRSLEKSKGSKEGVSVTV
jgi:cysteine desulfurase